VDADLTLAEAVTVLDPPMAEKQLRAIVRALRWQPQGWRHNGHGHPFATYSATEIMRLHAALLPFLR
jgi:hypothetical protein